MTLDTSRIEAGQIDDGATYDLYVPSSFDSGTIYQLLVSVLPRHETLPRYRALELFRDFAEQHRRLVLAPHFEFTSGFQWLGIGGDTRYDLRLLWMVEDVGRRYHPGTPRFDLFGYSAGGQFAHRFLYLHPERLNAAAIGAPGTVTLASLDHDWPTGIANLAGLIGGDIDLAEVRSRPILLFVGDRDVTSEALLQTEEANRLGRTRVERATSLHMSWLEAGIDHTYIEVPNMGHPDLDQGVGNVCQFFAGAN